MDLHNVVEDMVISRVDEILDALAKSGDGGKFCTCSQCRMDVICYTLNRIPPRYIVSNRGVSRVQDISFVKQQIIADVTSMIHEGLNRVSHNQRPNFAHSPRIGGPGFDPNLPMFNIPTIMGRLFNGGNFAPMADLDVELLLNGHLVPMKDGNWQNPCRMVSNMEGNFSFWPAPVQAREPGEHTNFEYSLRVSSPDFETLNHFFKIPVASEVQSVGHFKLGRTFKLPDLYMFPPGGDEEEGLLD